MLTPVPSQAIHSSPPIADCSRRVDSLVRVSQQQRWKNRKKKPRFFCLSLSGSLGLAVRTWAHGCGPGHTRQPTRETTERDAEVRYKWQFFWRRSRGPAPYIRRSAMHRSKLDIGGADAGAGGMSISSGSSGASGMGASSSSSDASAMAQPTGSSGAGSGSICLANNAPVACSSLATSTASRKNQRRCGRASDANQPSTPGLCRRGT